MELLCDGVTLSWAQSQHSQARFGLPRSGGERGDGVREVRSKASEGKTIRTGEKIINCGGMNFASPTPTFRLSRAFLRPRPPPRPAAQMVCSGQKWMGARDRIVREDA